MRNLFIAVELIDKQVRAILAERINGKIKVHGVENEDFSVSVVDDNGVLINHTILSSSLSSIVKKMENRAVNLLDNNQVKTKKIILALSCFPCTTFEETHTFSLNIVNQIHIVTLKVFLNILSILLYMGIKVNDYFAIFTNILHLFWLFYTLQFLLMQSSLLFF